MTILEIFIFKGEQLLGSRVYTDSVVTIGRSSSTLLPLDDRQISRHHATISVDGKRMLIRDEGSQLGTLVNGVPVKEQTFRESDTLSIGTFRLKVARRSMGQSLDFDEDEPTEAGQRHLRQERHGELTPSPGTVQPYLPPPPSYPQSSPTVRSAPQPASAPGLRPSPTPPSSPALPPRVPPSSPRVPQRIRDSDSSEIRAGLDDSVPIDLSMQDEVPQASAAVEAGGPPVSQALPVVEARSAAVSDREARSAAVSNSRAAEEFAADPLTTPRARTQPAAPPPLPEPPTMMLSLAQPLAQPPPPPVPAPPEQMPPASASARTQPPVISGLPGEEPPEARDFVPHEDGDEDDAEDDDFVPSFSLLERLSEEPMRPTSPTPPQLEIIHHRDGRVIDLLQVSAGGSFPASGPRLVQLDRSGRAQLSVTDDLTGLVFLNGKPIPLEEIRRGARDRKGVSVLELREGDRAEVITSHPAPAGAPPLRDHYHVRFIRPLRPQATPVKVRQVFKPLGNRYLVGALLLHGLLLLGLSRIPPDPPAPAEDTRFAEVSMKAIPIEPPQEPPKVKEPDPTPTPPEVKPALTKVRPVKVHVPQRAAPRQPQNALAALEMLKPADPNPSSLKDVVSNINAVSVPADARSRFKVGGAIGKLPVGEVRVSTAGAAHDSTTSSRELLSKGGVGDLKGAGGSGNVRGVVKQAPAAQLQFAGSGRLSKAQIQAVINEHVGQVQACYEKNLMRDHSLAGKITFDWVISPTGSVTSARVRSSTMAGSAVSTCILQEIRGWSFPTPEGGAVSVTYPFIFNAQGY